MSLNGINVGGHRRRPNVSVGFLVDEETVDFANLRKPVMFRKAIRGPVAETPGMTITDNHKRVGLRVVEYFGLPCEYTLDCSGRCKGIRGVSDLVTCPYDK